MATVRPVSGITLARVLIAAGVALALADASVVTLALPEILTRLGTTIDGVAGVIGVYTVVLAAAVLVAVPLRRRLGSATLGTAGMGLFALASVACGLADTLPLLLVARAVQAIGAAGGLVAAYALLHRHGRGVGGRSAPLWVAAAVFGTAIGPALGGVLTELFDWRAIFLAQAPFGLLAAIACRVPLGDPATDEADEPPAGRPRAATPGPATADRVRAGLALALVSAALTAVVFLLVLLLVSGWSISPLKAAIAVTLLPIAALAGSRIPGDPWVRASAGSALVGAGIVALASLPAASVVWIVLPQLLAGVGMGLALPALAGELLPEATPRDAARLLAMRHVGITVALLVLAPVTAAQLDHTITKTKEQVAALVLDARLPPQQKLDVIGPALGKLTPEDPRGQLEHALAAQAPRFAGNADQAKVYRQLSDRADETLVSAVDRAFRPAFLITALLALLAALAVLPRPGRRPALAVAVAGLVLAGGQTLVAHGQEPPQVVIANPCHERKLPTTGGLDGAIQDVALVGLDRAACRFGSSREELALAIGDPKLAKAYERAHGTNPRSIGSLIGGALSGGGGDGAGGVGEVLKNLLGG